MFHYKSKVVFTSSGSRKKRKRAVEYPDRRFRSEKYKAGRYCQQCYDKQPNNLSFTQKKTNCKTSRMGCPLCDEHIYVKPC